MSVFSGRSWLQRAAAPRNFLRGFTSGPLGLAEQHLSLDALVAFVDGELSPHAHDRAVAHVACCPNCAAEAHAQRQAREAVKEASAPSISPTFLNSLRSIPMQADLPDPLGEVVLSESGEVLTAVRPIPDRTPSTLAGDERA